MGLKSHAIGLNASIGGPIAREFIPGGSDGVGEFTPCRTKKCDFLNYLQYFRKNFHRFSCIKFNDFLTFLATNYIFPMEKCVHVAG